MQPACLRNFILRNAIMKLVTAVPIVGLILTFVNGIFIHLMIYEKCLAQIIYVDKKHMNISVEGGMTASLILGFYTPMKVGLFEKSYFE